MAEGEMQDWPFDDPKETPVTTVRQVIESGDWVYYVARDGETRQWHFYTKDHLQRKDRDTRFVLFEEIVSLEPRLKELHDLPVGWHAWREARQSEWERVPMPQGEVYYLRFRVYPSENNPESGVLGEGVVSCWIMAADRKEAEQAGRKEILEQLFDCQELEHCELIASADQEDEENVGYYRQALIDGTVFLYDLSPKHPVYYLEYTVRPIASSSQSAKSTERKAAFCISNESVVGSGEVYEEGFWNQDRIQVAEDQAGRAIREAGWEISRREVSRPCCRSDFEEDRYDLYDEAESTGTSLDFWIDQSEKKQ